MNIRQIQIKKLINTITKKDTLFQGKYTLDPYQNCEFACIYCDSALEDTIYVKINAVDILKKEIKKTTKGRIIIGSVHDPYQSVEQRFHLTRDILSYISTTSFPVHILTKSPDIINDLSIIKKIKKPIITFTILGLQESFYQLIEPNAPPPMKRFEAIKTLRDNNITSGIAIIPLFPKLSQQNIEDLIHTAKNYDVSYLLYKPIFLQGYQKQVFLDKIKGPFPHVHRLYHDWFKNNPFPPKSIIDETTEKINMLCQKNNISIGISK